MNQQTSSIPHHASSAPQQQNAEAAPPFPVAGRIGQLPPYLFARINKLTYEKRRAGCDVIDMSMGNPTDPPAQFIIDKLAEAANDPRSHGYAPAAGIASLRREVASRYLRKWGVRLDPETEVISTLGSKEGFGHLCQHRRTQLTSTRWLWPPATRWQSIPPSPIVSWQRWQRDAKALLVRRSCWW